MVEVGKLYFVGPCKFTKDRSYMEQAWRVQAIDGPMILATPVTAGFWDKTAMWLFRDGEREWTEVSKEFVDKMSPATLTGYGI